MNWLNQFSLVMRSSLTTLRESVENPERTLHQLIIDMEEELDRVRCSVAQAVADEIQMRRRCERERADAERWMDRASTAMTRGDESAAKAALDQKLSAQQRADRYAAEHEKQKTDSEKLQASVRDLEDKIRQAKQKKTLLMARMARASSSQKINAALERSSSQSAFAQFSRLEQQVEREEALTEAWDRMDGKDPDAAELEQEFARQEHAQNLARELAALKARTTPESET